MMIKNYRLIIYMNKNNKELMKIIDKARSWRQTFSRSQYELKASSLACRICGFKSKLLILHWLEDEVVTHYYLHTYYLYNRGTRKTWKTWPSPNTHVGCNTFIQGWSTFIAIIVAQCSDLRWYEILYLYCFNHVQ